MTDWGSPIHLSESIDLVERLNLGAIPPGIERSVGICESRPGSGPDTAYKISSRAVASIPTAQVFPDGFPSDFSILATFRADQNTKSMLFTIYSSEGEEVLSLKIARRLRFQYQGTFDNNKKRVKIGPNLADGKWHRLGISVKGNSITTLVDCKQQTNRPIQRDSKDTISTSGIILLAQQIDDNTFFNVSLGILVSCLKRSRKKRASDLDPMFWHCLYVNVKRIFRENYNNSLLSRVQRLLMNNAKNTFLIVIELYLHPTNKMIVRPATEEFLKMNS